MINMPGGDQLITGASRRSRIPSNSRNIGRLSEHVAMVISDLTQFGDGLGQAATFGCYLIALP